MSRASVFDFLFVCFFQITGSHGFHFIGLQIPRNNTAVCTCIQKLSPIPAAAGTRAGWENTTGPPSRGQPLSSTGPRALPPAPPPCFRGPRTLPRTCSHAQPRSRHRAGGSRERTQEIFFLGPISLSREWSDAARCVCMLLKANSNVCTAKLLHKVDGRSPWMGGRTK